ncbi:hypothetical protein Tco_0003568 [Tanacetum coccineum]
MEKKDTSSCLDLEEQEIQRMHKKARIMKEGSMNGFRALQSNFKLLSRKDVRGLTEGGFKRAFLHFFREEVSTFKRMLSQNMDTLKKQLTKEKLLINDSRKTALTVFKTPFEKNEISNTWNESSNSWNESSKTGNESNRLGNKCNYSGDENSNSGNDTNADGADMRPNYDTEPLKNVYLNDKYNVFGNTRQHSKQLDSINDTYVMKKVDSNVNPDSSYMSNNEGEVEQDDAQHKKEHALLVYLLKT